MSMKDDCPYQRVEYLEVSEESGWAYIATNYVPQGYDNDIFVTLTLLGYAGDSERTRLLGAYTSESANAYRILRNNSSLNEIILQNGVLATKHQFETIAKLEIGKKTEIVMKHDGTCLLDGRSFALDTQRSDIQNTANLNLFLHAAIDASPYLRLYSFRLDKADITQLDLIPVRIGSEGFMYDRVSGKLFGNSGSGKFILGPDIN